MTTIHMNIHSARSIRRNLVRMYESGRNTIQSASSVVSSLPPDWRSHSADIFFSQYNHTASQITRTLSRLKELADEIDNEIDRYERMADKLSG
jgi:uncharacterized protein YukE